jgi:hypothetical protein
MNIWLPILLFFNLGLILVNFFVKTPFLCIVGILTCFVILVMPVPNEYMRWGIGVLMAFYTLQFLAMVFSNKRKKGY